MNRVCLSLLLLLLLSLNVFAQETEAKVQVDSLFREDQVYVSLSYNLVQNSPNGFKQFSFSPTIAVGFLRDFPFSKNRKWAIAPGIGYSYNNIKQVVSSDDLLGETTATPEKIKTKIVSHSIEVPLEIRWRNATYDSHKFWRIHTGFKARYILDTKLKLYSSEGKESVDVNELINKWQYGAYLTTGYNTWNVYVYYGLNPIFKNGSKLSDLNVGFMFYIL